MYLPANTVLGSLQTTDILVNSISNKLTNCEKRDKVFKELKIDENDYINEDTKVSLKNLVEEFLDVFSESKFDIGDTDLMEAEINLDNGNQPIVSGIHFSSTTQNENLLAKKTGGTIGDSTDICLSEFEKHKNGDFSFF